MHQSQSETSGRMPRSISSSQKSVYHSSDTHVPAKMLNHLLPQTRSRNEMVHPDHMKQVTVFTRRRHLRHFLSNLMLPLIMSPLLSVAWKAIHTQLEKRIRGNSNTVEFCNALEKIANEISPDYKCKLIYRVTILPHNICNMSQFHRVRFVMHYKSIV